MYFHDPVLLIWCGSSRLIFKRLCCKISIYFIFFFKNKRATVRVAVQNSHIFEKEMKYQMFFETIRTIRAIRLSFKRLYCKILIFVVFSERKRSILRDGVENWHIFEKDVKNRWFSELYMLSGSWYWVLRGYVGKL